jgi:glycine/D-amino acid oxidase-like deaminating enzyme
MEVDYIVVGFGLAGMAFVKTLEEHQKSFVVFEDASQTSSKVAGGVYNPVVLKRFTPVWQGGVQLKEAIPFYKQLEKKFNTTYDYKFETRRIFSSVEEQNNWYVASEKPLLKEYLDDHIVTEKHHGVVADFGMGKVKKTGRIAVKKLIEDYKNYLIAKEKILFESFVYTDIEFRENKVFYKGVNAKKIIFCEGYGLHKNPFFSYLPMQEAKGETITIYAQKLKVDFLIKSAVFVLPIGEDCYKVGATFNWKDKTSIPTMEAKMELIEKLESFMKVPYKVIDHTAGIRPTVKDRRPLVGLHSEFQQLAILNGLGTRGVMIAPKLANELYHHIEHHDLLDPECDIARF